MPGMLHVGRRRLVTAIVCAVACAAAACTSTSRRQAATAPEASIGVATMETDGTIVLRLRATAPGGVRGEGYFRYPPGDKDYESVLEHLGGLRPGESKPVPPWPDPK